MAFSFGKLFKKIQNAGPKGDSSVLGIDIGASSAKIVQLRASRGIAVLETYGEISLGPYANQPIGKVVKLSPEKAAEAIIDLMREGHAIGGVVIDEGEWRDLGSRKEYLEVHRVLRTDLAEKFPRYGAPDHGWREWISPQARLGAGARVLGCSAIGAGAVIGDGALVEDSLIWPGGEVAAGAKMRQCIVRGGRVAAGELKGRDV